MSLPEIVTPEQWLVARRELLAREKEQTRQRDALNADRRRLPMVEMQKYYRFEGPAGTVGLGDLFGGRRQLVIQHAMFDPSWETACPGCSAAFDELAPAVIAHLGTRDTAFAAVSRAPFAMLASLRAAKGWEFDWYSSFGSDFNVDFLATVTPDTYNFGTYAAADDEPSEPSEVGGYSCFLRDGERIFHTYSTFARGTDQVGSAYTMLDLTVLGRQEDWEEPKGRVARPHPADPTFTS